MNKLLALCGLVFIGNTTTPKIESILTQEDFPSKEIVNCQLPETQIQLVSTEDVVDEVAFFHASKRSKNEFNSPAEMDINEIVFIECEETIDLGFDTADYLPENFDPHKVYVDLNSVNYIEENKEVALNFDTATYLPNDFNPYAIPADITSISYLEEEEITLGFDTALYLPEGFDPYEVYFDLNSVEYIEEEDEVEFDFDTSDYLPKGFDPFS